MYNSELKTIIYFGNFSKNQEDVFKRELINFAQSIVDSVPVLFNSDFNYDGVIINNVIDIRTREQISHEYRHGKQEMASPQILTPYLTKLLGMVFTHNNCTQKRRQKRNCYNGTHGISYPMAHGMSEERQEKTQHYCRYRHT